MKTRISSHIPREGGSPSVDNMDTRLRGYCKELGFDVVAITSPDLPMHASQGLQEFLDHEHHGDMGWMAGKTDRRADPRTLWPEVQSIIVVGHNYAPEMNPLTKLSQKHIGNISCYALNQDYHDVIKKKLKALARFVAEEYGCEVKVFVDTAPVMEKPLAEAAGIGWQGKHTCLVSREFGSWLFLASIFTTLPLDKNTEMQTCRNTDSTPTSSVSLNSALLHSGSCGTCTKCLDICPTQAFTAPHKIDARKCISYLTIEHKGQIPLEYRKAIGNRIYGCDDCLAICPWNKFAKESREIAYHPRKELDAPLLSELVQLDDAAFRALFTKSPVKRIGRDRFVRNVLVAIGNSEDASLIPIITPLLDDTNPLVAEMAEWAIHELSGTC